MIDSNKDQNFKKNSILYESINHCKKENYNKAFKNLKLRYKYSDWKTSFIFSSIESKKKNKKQILKHSKFIQTKLPNSRFANNNLGNIYLKLGIISKAIKYFKFSVSSKTDEINISQNFKLFLKNIKRCKSLVNSKKSKDILIFKVKEQLEDIKTKISLRQIVTLGRPHFAELYNKIELLLIIFDKITSDLKIINQKKINNSDILRVINKIIKLEIKFNLLTRVNADYENPYFNLAQCYKQKKNYHKSNKYFVLANEFDKTNKYNYRILENLYLLNERKNFNNLLKKINKNSKTDFYSLAVAHFASEQWKIKNQYSFCNNPLSSIYKKNVLDKNFNINTLKLVENEIKKNRNKLNTPVVIGHKSTGNLFESKSKNIKELKKIIIKNIKIYKKKFNFDKNIMIKKFPKKYELNGWFISLKKGGQVTSHIHDGWLSGVFYVKKPKQKNLFKGDIELTSRYNDLPFKNKLHNKKILKIESGDLLLFPSSLPHRVISFNSNYERLSIAFDMKPII